MNYVITSINDRKINYYKKKNILETLSKWFLEEWKDDFYINDFIPSNANINDMKKHLIKLPKNTLFFIHYNFNFVIGTYIIRENDFPYKYIPRRDFESLSKKLNDLFYGYKWLTCLYVNKLYRNKNIEKILIDNALNRERFILTWCKNEEIDIYTKNFETYLIYYNCRISIFTIYKY